MVGQSSNIPPSATGNDSRGIECIVYGCHNRSNEGRFIGEICLPCHTMIKTGEVGLSTNFIAKIYNETKPKRVYGEFKNHEGIVFNTSEELEDYVKSIKFERKCSFCDGSGWVEYDIQLCIDNPDMEKVDMK